jgi:hypothetical protein
MIMLWILNFPTRYEDSIQFRCRQYSIVWFYFWTLDCHCDTIRLDRSSSNQIRTIMVLILVFQSWLFFFLFPFFLKKKKINKGKLGRR